MNPRARHGAHAIIAAGDQAHVRELRRAIIVHQLARGVIIDRQDHHVVLVDETVDVIRGHVILDGQQGQWRLGDARQQFRMEDRRLVAAVAEDHPAGVGQLEGIAVDEHQPAGDPFQHRS